VARRALRAGAFRDNVVAFLAEFGAADAAPAAPGLRAWSVPLRVPGSQARGLAARFCAAPRARLLTPLRARRATRRAAQGPGGAHTLRVYEESVQQSGRTHCDACRCVGAPQRRAPGAAPAARCSC
jgi:hypothetical protein